MGWQTEQLKPWQSLLIGGLSGGMGPLCNNPRMLNASSKTSHYSGAKCPDIPDWSGLSLNCQGRRCLGLVERNSAPRIMPGQTITFMTYRGSFETIACDEAILIARDKTMSMHSA
jgi:solute carrier family 25 citrate transporter 1